jgi:hypothetical protein
VVEKKVAELSLSKVIIPWIWEKWRSRRQRQSLCPRKLGPLMHFVLLKFCLEGKLYARCWLAAIVAAMGLVSKLLDAEHALLTLSWARFWILCLEFLEGQVNLFIGPCNRLGPILFTRITCPAWKTTRYSHLEK